MNDATDAIAMLENELDRKDAQVKELFIKLTMLLENGTSVERWMDIAMDGEVSSNGDGRGVFLFRNERVYGYESPMVMGLKYCGRSSARTVSGATRAAAERTPWRLKRLVRIMQLLCIEKICLHDESL